MLTILSKKADIQKAQEKFKKAFSGRSERTEKVKVGHQGASFPVSVSWYGKLELWWTFDTEDNRYWCAFGTDEPRWGSSHSHSIICEINSPHSGIYRLTSGAFAVDEKDQLYVLHRGRIGGGRTSIGKRVFIDNFSGTWLTVNDGGRRTDVALVGCLEERAFPEDVSWFIHEVKRIKEVARGGKKYADHREHKYTPEFFGLKEYSTSRNVKAECSHGLVVKSLREELQKAGLNVANDRYRDLYVIGKGGATKTLFEIKTGDSISDVYSAIGQLLFHSALEKKRPKLVAVLPFADSKSSKHTRAALNALRIECLPYSWNRRLPVFSSSDLRKIM
ncbi:MAG: hypothetical protein KAR39_02925 [Thermoplasmata archaeon]|nr:hypothetical protein [Thermoplasmata archaeon]